MQTIKKGSRGADVVALQKKLNLIADGIFGSITDEAVRDFQRSHNLTVDGIVGPKTWAALGVVSPTNARRIDKIILHCSATPEGEDYSVAQIRQMHIARGFTDIGYHCFIGRDGTIYKGRDESKVGAHTTGYNAHSIGVCYCGGCPPRSVKDWDHKGKDTRTPAQRAAIIKLCNELKSRYPSATLHGHNEFANKACLHSSSKTTPTYAPCNHLPFCDLHPCRVQVAKQLQTSQSVNTDSLAHSEHHRTIAVIDSAIRHSDFSFDTLKIEIERPSSVDEAPEVIRLKAVKGRVIDRQQMFRDSVEAYNSLDTVQYKQSAIEASTEHTATTRLYNPPNGTAICIVAIVIAGILIYLFCRKR